MSISPRRILAALSTAAAAVAQDVDSLLTQAPEAVPQDKATNKMTK